MKCFTCWLYAKDYIDIDVRLPSPKEMEGIYRGLL